MVKHPTLSLQTLHFALDLKELRSHIHAKKGTVSNFSKNFLFELENFYFANLISRRDSFVFLNRYGVDILSIISKGRGQYVSNDLRLIRELLHRIVESCIYRSL